MSTEPQLEPAIVKAQSGNTEAFEIVVRHFQRPIRAWCIGRCPPGGDADDVAQNTFLAAFNRLSEYKPGTDFRAWLFAIARYQMMTECTRLRRLADYHNRYAPHALFEALECQADRQSDELDHRLNLLQDCLSNLQDNQATILRSRYHDEESIAAIAQRTGRTANAIRKQLCILRQALHQCIENKMTSEATS